MITYIEKRLSELEEEKSELKRFQDLDSNRRCLEYSIYAQEQGEAVESLADMEATRENASEKSIT